jgi:hypothetical protein
MLGVVGRQIRTTPPKVIRSGLRAMIIAGSDKSCERPQGRRGVSIRGRLAFATNVADKLCLRRPGVIRQGIPRRSSQAGPISGSILNQVSFSTP